MRLCDMNESDECQIGRDRKALDLPHLQTTKQALLRSISNSDEQLVYKDFWGEEPLKFLSQTKSDL